MTGSAKQSIGEPKQKAELLRHFRLRPSLCELRRTRSLVELRRTSLASHAVVIPRACGYPVRRGFSIPSQASLEYWVARSSRAMTIESVVRSYSRQTSAISRRDASEFEKPFAQQIRGRRECRVPAAPAASRAKLSEAHERSHHRFRRINRHSPRNGFTAYSVLSPAIEFLLSPSPAD
jgi:hypothetical protein